MRTKVVRRSFISVLAICYGVGGHATWSPRAFDLPKAKAIAVPFGTPNCNELPIVYLSSIHLYMYKSGIMPLEATSQGLVAQVPKSLPFIPFHNPLSHPLSSPSPIADGKPVCRAKAQD